MLDSDNEGPLSEIQLIESQWPTSDQLAEDSDDPQMATIDQFFDDKDRRPICQILVVSVFVCSFVCSVTAMIFLSKAVFECPAKKHYDARAEMMHLEAEMMPVEALLHKNFTSGMTRMTSFISGLEAHMNNELTVAKDFEYPAITWFEWAFSAFILIFILLCSGCCCFLPNRHDGETNMFGHEEFLWTKIQYPTLSGLYAATNRHIVQGVLNAELLVQLVQPFIVFPLALMIALLLGSCEIPLFIQMFLVFYPVSRLICVDYSLCAARKVDLFTHLIPLITSKGEAADSSSDGVALATVFLLELHHPYFRNRLVASWSTGFASLFLPFIEFGGLTSLMGLCLLLASAAQTFVGGCVLLTSGNMENKSKLLGLGGLAKALADPKYIWPCNSATGKVRVNQECLGHLVRVIMEAAPQLYLQGSAIMAKGEGVVGSPVLALSICLSCGMGMTKCLHLMKVGIDLCKMDDDEWIVGVIWLISGFVGFIVLALSMVRPFAAELCDSGSWGVFSGCVAMPAFGNMPHSSYVPSISNMTHPVDNMSHPFVNLTHF